MPYYGDGVPYYYGGPFSNHSSLMTGTGRSLHGPLTSRFAPHLSTITESPLSNIRRYSPAAVSARPRRVVDTADIDVSTPRTLTGDTGRQKNRLRRDRPTIKIRSQALKDNPALRKHNERHEKTVGELLVEKFLIKDKKFGGSPETKTKLYHQASLDQSKNSQDLQAIQRRITRRLTRRRSSADLQLDPEQIVRELAYAQAQAQVLDSLVAEEQAEIEDEVRRGTLVRKATVRGPRTVPSFFGSEVEPDDATTQKGEEAAASRMKKTLRKMKKKKKKATDKPSPPENEEYFGTRMSSTSSDVSSEVSSEVSRTDESGQDTDGEFRPQMFKIEACNSVGDFSTIWVNATSGNEERKGSIEQFRESIKIPVPRKILLNRSISEIPKGTPKEPDDGAETQIVLPVRRPYVTDTSRNSVHLTVKTNQEKSGTKKLENGVNAMKAGTIEGPFESTINDPKGKGSPFRKVSESTSNQTKVDSKTIATEKKKRPFAKNEIFPATLEEEEKSETTVRNDSQVISRPTAEKISKDVKKKLPTKSDREDESAKASPSEMKRRVSLSGSLNGSEVFSARVAADGDKEVILGRSAASEDPKSSSTLDVAEDVATRRGVSACPIVAADTTETSARSAVPPSLATTLGGTSALPKPSKINADRNNAVEAPELSLRAAVAYLPNCPSSGKQEKEEEKRRREEKEEGVESALSGKTVIKDSALARKNPIPKISERVIGSDAPKSSVVTRGREESKTVRDGATATTTPEKETTLPKVLKNEAQKVGGDGECDVKDVERLKAEAREHSGDWPKNVRGKIEAERTNGVASLKSVEREKESRVDRGPKTEPDKVNEKDAAKEKISSPILPKSAIDKQIGSTENKVPPKVKRDDKAPDSSKPLRTFNLPKSSRANDEKFVDPIAAKKEAADAPKTLKKRVSVDTGPKSAVESPLLSRADGSKRVRQSTSLDETRPSEAMKPREENKLTKSQDAKSQIIDAGATVAEHLIEESGRLSKSTSSESIDFWSEIKPSETVKAKAKTAGKATPTIPERPNITSFEVEKCGKSGSPTIADPSSTGKSSTRGELADKKKETDLKISVAPSTPIPRASNIPVIEGNEARNPADPVVDASTASRFKIEADVAKVDTPLTLGKQKADLGWTKRNDISKEGEKKNLAIDLPLARELAEKKLKLRREDSTTSSGSTPSTVVGTPDPSTPVSEVFTPVAEVSVPIINVVEATIPFARSSCRKVEEDDDEGPGTPTNDITDSSPSNIISKWNNQEDLSNATDLDKDQEATPVPSRESSAATTPAASAPSSKKKKKVTKKKRSGTKKNGEKKGSKGSSEKDSSKLSQASSSASTAKNTPTHTPTATLKPPSTSSPRNTPTQRPLDLIRMFYTTPSALLTATPRDLSKVRRAKIKRRKHQSRTPSVSSDSTGSTTSTATTESTDGSGTSTCTELEDDPEHKRLASTRSNDSGFDGSPRILNCDMACHKKCEKLTGNLCGLNQKLVAEALQALKRAPSQSDHQRNSDTPDHFSSGRITPPATNLPRFKKYAVTDFNFLKVLGKGSFGKVLLAELRGTECVYAVKCLKKDVVLEDDDVECTLIERKVLTLATRHPYLCHLFCTFQTDSHLFFVMEYLNGGDLMFHIQKSGRFSEPRARFYAAEIWSGLNFLHKKGIVYRDLKLDNVLLDFDGHIRIADFGMCKLQIFLDRTADTFCGTPDYMAPEIIKGLKYNQAVDWWSFGVLLYEMLTGQSPFSGCDEDELFWSICNERPFIPRYLSQEATDMLVCLLEKDSGKRPPGHEIAMHPFFQSLPWDRLERRQLDPPFKPALEHTLDTKYFDTAFTAERPRLTPVPEQILTSMDQGVFRGFSYTNPNATD